MSAARKIVCMLTGSKESAAAALLTKRQGYNVSGAFIQNKYASAEQNAEQQDRVQYTCDKLEIPYHHVTLPPTAWDDLEKVAGDEYQRGGTPDLAVLFNRHVLFGSAYHHLVHNMRAVGLTTGHFARSSLPSFDWNRHPHHSVQLLRSVDLYRDESHSLSQIPQMCLRNTMFPLGEVAHEALPAILWSGGLEHLLEQPPKTYQECEMHKRMNEDILKTLPKKRGTFVNVETKAVEGNFENFYEWRVGQSVTVRDQTFVIGHKDSNTGTITLAPSREHPSLYSETFFVSLMHWIWQVPYNFYEKQMMDCEYKLRESAISPCTLTVGMNNEYCGNDHVIVSTGQPTGPVVPGQYCSIYLGEVCLGSGKVLHAGPSMYAMNYSQYQQSQQNTTSTPWTSWLQKIRAFF